MAPYLVCGEETLKRFAKYRPSTLAKLGEIDGVGEQRFEQYGEVFFDAVDSFCKRRGLSRDCAPPDSDVVQAAAAAAGRTLPKIGPTKEEAYRMFTEELQSVEQVATSKQVKVDTVINYLLDVYMNGWPLEFDRLPRLPAADVKDIQAAVKSIVADGGDLTSMKAIKERLVDMEVPYINIRLQLARDGHLQRGELIAEGTNATGARTNEAAGGAAALGAASGGSRKRTHLDAGVGVREWSGASAVECESRLTRRALSCARSECMSVRSQTT